MRRNNKEKEKFEKKEKDIISRAIPRKSDKKEKPERSDKVAKSEKGEKNKSYSLKKGALKIIPLGGLHEIGKNMTVLEYADDIIIIDCGLSFPEDEMYGIDIVIPDFSYLEKNREKIRGLVITHGHEDHIGAIPYLLKEFNLPIYGTRLTLSIVENKLKEHGIKGNLRKFKPGDFTKLGAFKIETIRTTHSIADSVCLSIETPVGRIFHTGDFKIDYTPIDGEPIDFHRLAQIGNEGVLLMMADSTNAEREGYTKSEKLVGTTLENIVGASDKRILIATFSSNVHRVQRIIDTCVKCERKMAISGRSMVNIVKIAQEQGYLKIPEGVLVDINKTKGIPNNKLLIVTTGSQGEPMSALSRMASNEHKAIQIRPDDMVILSSNPVPGNEKSVSNVVNKLLEKGAEVVYSDIADVHVSGHACKEELKLLHSLIRPKYFAPVHGEYRQLKSHATLAENLGMPVDNIFIMDNGKGLSLTKNKCSFLKEEVQAGATLVDGLGVGDVGNIVLRDRKLLSESGLIIVVAAINREDGYICSGPEIISRGFVYVRENEDLIDNARELMTKVLNDCYESGTKDWNALKTAVKNELKNFIYEKTKRSPIILPIFLEV